MSTGVVVIGRNEGARLAACLSSLADQVGRVVYVDSGSRDGSVGVAREMGVEVVELDGSAPFTAARARNAGAAALEPACDKVQFVDGDCAVEPGWIAKGEAALDGDAGIGIVTGWRSEVAPEASIYNAMAETEWHRPAGDIVACGGDMMVRRAVFDEVGGFDARVIAAEDDEFCLRVGAAGHRVVRLPEPMTRHDAAMTRFSQWWRRAVRSGHGFAEVGGLHPAHFRPERLRVWFYGGLVPLMLIFGPWPIQVLAVLAYAANWLRTMQGLKDAGMEAGLARRQAALLTLSKIPNIIGMLTYHVRRLRGTAPRLIEYK